MATASRCSSLKNVKLATEDNPQEPDDFLAYLCYLWRNNISINNQLVKGQLTIIGSIDKMVIDWTAEHFSQAAHWLPGVCDGCTLWVMERTECYWGAHAHLCFKCLEWSLQYFAKYDRWPEGNWFPDELSNLEGINLEADEDDEA